MLLALCPGRATHIDQIDLLCLSNQHRLLEGLPIVPVIERGEPVFDAIGGESRRSVPAEVLRSVTRSIR